MPTRASRRCMLLIRHGDLQATCVGRTEAGDWPGQEQHMMRDIYRLILGLIMQAITRDIQN